MKEVLEDDTYRASIDPAALVLSIFTAGMLSRWEKPTAQASATGIGIVPEQGHAIGGTPISEILPTTPEPAHSSGFSD